jgi:hypothetical protein
MPQGYRPMGQFSHELNIKCYRNLLETSLDEAERRTIQKIIVEEERKQASLPNVSPCLTENKVAPT